MTHITYVVLLMTMMQLQGSSFDLDNCYACYNKIVQQKLLNAKTCFLILVHILLDHHNCTVYHLTSSRMVLVLILCHYGYTCVSSFICQLDAFVIVACVK